MTLPKDAKYEARVAGGIVLYDVSHLMPTHATKQYRTRRPSRIIRAYHHHSGALGSDGFRGAYNSSRYVVTKKDKNGNDAGWPGAAYTFWFSYVPDYDHAGNMVIYRLNPDNLRSYHTGKKANDHGIGICWQGNLQGMDPSMAQYEMAEGFCPWVNENYPNIVMPNGHSFHSEAGRFGGKTKASCPGPFVEEWVRDWREDMAK